MSTCPMRGWFARIVGVAVYPNHGIGRVDLNEHADADYWAKSTEGFSVRLKLAVSR